MCTKVLPLVTGSSGGFVMRGLTGAGEVLLVSITSAKVAHDVCSAGTFTVVSDLIVLAAARSWTDLKVCWPYLAESGAAETAPPARATVGVPPNTLNVTFVDANRRGSAPQRITSPKQEEVWLCRAKRLCASWKDELDLLWVLIFLSLSSTSGMFVNRLGGH